MAIKIKWLGKNYHNHRTIGKVKADHTTVQGFLDWVATQGDASASNRYFGEIERDHWTNADARVRHLSTMSHVGLVGQSLEGSILETNDYQNYNEGTYTLGYDDTNLTEDVTLSNFRLVNNMSGAASGGGGAPEGALYIGKESSHPSSVAWDNIQVVGMMIEGVHDALQFHGSDEDFTGVPGYCLVKGNILNSCHDAFTYKGDVRIWSHHNTIYSNSGGVPPYLDDVDNWKTTGIHHNVDTGAVAGTSRNANSWFRSHHDSIRVIVTGNAQMGGQQEYAQAKTCGILIYTGTASNRPPVKSEFIGTVIHVTHDAEVRAARVADYAVAGFAFIPDTAADSKGSTCAEDEMILKDFRMNVEQLNTGTDAPDNAAGIWVRNRTAVTGHIKAQNGMIHCSNAHNNAYSIRVEGSGAVVEKDSIASDVATSVVNSGTITSLPMVADNP